MTLSQIVPQVQGLIFNLFYKALWDNFTPLTRDYHLLSLIQDNYVEHGPSTGDGRILGLNVHFLFFRDPGLEP